MQELKSILSTWAHEREDLLEENQKLQSIMDGKNTELDKKTYMNGKLLMKLAMAYVELDRISTFNFSN